MVIDGERWTSDTTENKPFCMLLRRTDCVVDSCTASVFAVKSRSPLVTLRVTRSPRPWSARHELHEPLPRAWRLTFAPPTVTRKQVRLCERRSNRAHVLLRATVISACGGLRARHEGLKAIHRAVKQPGNSGSSLTCRAE